MKNALILGLLLIPSFFIIRYFYHKPDVIKGDKAPNFSFTTLEGKARELQDFEGSTVILDFWGSWCAPCREESPKLVDLFKKYHSSHGLEIISIGIESNVNAWSKAIARDGLLWDNHHTDANKFSSEIAKTYGITSIPTKILIDKKGQIVYVNPNFEQIESFLTKNPS